ncbi:hypothetical protein HanRHA438_Chr08g0367721 [Helianthus annuus]|nr:hypothetical protein HanRHA438_Chr08g0367721 [Helianthus annuus]
MVPLPGNSKLVQTRYSSCDQVVIASQLASIAASIDSMRKDIAEIMAQVIRDDFNSEESDISLKNTVAEAPHGSEHDPLQQLGSGSGGGITVRNDVTGDGIEGADDMDDEMGTNETDKIDGTRIDAWGAAENLTENDNHEQKGRGEIGALFERLVFLPRSLSLLVCEELVQFINEGCKLNYHDCTVVLRVSSPLLFMTTTISISRQLSVLRKTPQRPGTVVVFFIIVWDPGKEILVGPTWRKPTEGECVHTNDSSQFLSQTLCRSIGLFGSPCTCGNVLNGNKLRDYNNPLQKATTFGSRRYIQAGLNSADFKWVEINENDKATWDDYDLFKNQFPYLRLEDKSIFRAGSIDTNPWVFDPFNYLQKWVLGGTVLGASSGQFLAVN